MTNFIPVDEFNPVALAIFAALALLSLIAVTVGIYKFVQFIRFGVGRQKEAELLLDTWLSGHSDDAMATASEGRSVLLRILQSVFSGLLACPSDPSYAEELGRQTAIIELANLSHRMRLLDMVVQSAPMLGLLGTVVGMIDAFQVLALDSGGVNPALLANGIWTALATTAVGLGIALVAYFIATYFEARIERERNVIEAVISAAIHGRVDPSMRKVRR